MESQCWVVIFSQVGGSQHQTVVYAANACEALIKSAMAYPSPSSDPPYRVQVSKAEQVIMV